MKAEEFKEIVEKAMPGVIEEEDFSLSYPVPLSMSVTDIRRVHLTLVKNDGKGEGILISEADDEKLVNLIINRLHNHVSQSLPDEINYPAFEIWMHSEITDCLIDYANGERDSYSPYVNTKVDKKRT